MRHRQLDPDEGHQRFVTEPVWTQLLPLTATAQYMLFWYVAETVPPDLENDYSASGSQQASERVYAPPVSFPEGQRLSARIAQDRVTQDGEETTYQPVWHPNTGVDEEERLYRSSLLPIADAMRKLRGSVMEDVVRRDWEGIQTRMAMEAAEEGQAVCRRPLNTLKGDLRLAYPTHLQPHYFRSNRNHFSCIDALFESRREISVVGIVDV